MTKSGLLLAVVAYALFSAATTQAALLSHYTFDNSANIGANSVNSAYNGTPASTSGAALPGSVTGFLGRAMSTNLNNSLQIPATCPPGGGTMGRTGTFSVWAKGNLDDPNTDSQLLAMGGGGTIWIDTEQGRFGAYLISSQWQSMYWVGAQDSWPDSTNWHHITISWSVYNGSVGSGREQVYIDGNPIAMNSTNNPTFGGYSNNWTSASTWGNSFTTHQINGDRPMATNNWCNGMTGAMDDWSLWDTEFTAGQAKALNNLNKDSALKYNAKDADSLFNLYVNGGSAVVGGTTWIKYGTGTAFDGTGALTGGATNASLALGSNGGVQIALPIPVDVTWTGGTSTAWSTATGLGNWKKTSDNTGADYGNGAAVIFNDSAAGLTANIGSGDVSPASVVFNNSNKNFVVTGTKGIVGSATVLKQGTGKVTLSSVNNYTGVTTVEAGTLQFNGAAARNPVINLGGANIKAGKMIFDYAGETDPAGTIGALLTTSYHSGSATHFDTAKFQSSSADANHGLGWIENTSQQVLVAYTLYGDASVNGGVDLSDLALLGANWNGSGKVWAEGDFNYDGKVDLTDLALLGAHWNQSIAGFSGGIGSDSGAAVPEPSTLALLAAGVIGLLAYAWRKRK